MRRLLLAIPVLLALAVPATAAAPSPYEQVKATRAVIAEAKVAEATATAKTNAADEKLAALEAELKPKEEPPKETRHQTTWNKPGTVPAKTDCEYGALVERKPEIHADNTPYNEYVPSDSELAAYTTGYKGYGWPPNDLAAHVTGRDCLTKPSTHDLIEWVALKWGIPADWIEAQMGAESTQHQCHYGDRAAVTASDYAAYSNVCGGKIAGTQEAYTSDCIASIKWIPSRKEHLGSEPLRWKSTAFCLDYYAMNIRAYYDGRAEWLHPTCDVPSEEWASIGRWFTPNCGDAGAANYIKEVQRRLAEGDWERAGY